MNSFVRTVCCTLGIWWVFLAVPSPTGASALRNPVDGAPTQRAFQFFLTIDAMLRGFEAPGFAIHNTLDSIPEIQQGKDQVVRRLQSAPDSIEFLLGALRPGCGTDAPALGRARLCH